MYSTIIYLPPQSWKGRAVNSGRPGCLRLTSRNPLTLRAWLDLFCELAEVVRRGRCRLVRGAGRCVDRRARSGRECPLCAETPSGSLQDAEMLRDVLLSS